MAHPSPQIVDRSPGPSTPIGSLAHDELHCRVQDWKEERLGGGVAYAEGKHTYLGVNWWRRNNRRRRDHRCGNYTTNKKSRKKPVHGSSAFQGKMQSGKMP